MSKHHYSYLALGDSYTIGESVPLHESFPYQVVQLLRKSGKHFYAPEIIAKTGWTSAQLAEQILHSKLNDSYDFVTLLIGVNNQYQGLSIQDFATDFDFLLRKALHLTGEKNKQVIVLSIPDWGLTPFATKKDHLAISAQIEAFNQICLAGSKKAGTHFIDITEESRKVKKDKSLLAADQLHYSGNMHAIWAEKVAKLMAEIS